jgi:hypothetical protein
MEQRQASERRRVAEEAERLRAQAEQTASWNEAEAQRLREQASQLSAESERKLAAERSAVIGKHTWTPSEEQDLNRRMEVCIVVPLFRWLLVGIACI